MYKKKEKKKCVKLGLKQIPLQLLTLCTTVNETCFEKFLSFKLFGIGIDDKLSWVDHVDRICRMSHLKYHFCIKLKCILPIYTKSLFSNK